MLLGKVARTFSILCLLKTICKNLAAKSLSITDYTLVVIWTM